MNRVGFLARLGALGAAPALIPLATRMAPADAVIAEDVEWAFGDGAIQSPWYGGGLTQSTVNVAWRQAATSTLWVRTASGEIYEWCVDSADVSSSPEGIAGWMRFHLAGGARP